MIGLFALAKHLQGQHDQKRHGRRFDSYKHKMNQIEIDMLVGEVDTLYELGKATNPARVVAIEDGMNLAIFKEPRGITEYKKGNKILSLGITGKREVSNEVSAYRLDRYLDLNMVPETVSSPDGRQSRQHFDEEFQEAYEFTHGKYAKINYEDELQGVASRDPMFADAAVFDYIRFETDRHGGNFGLGTNKKPVLVDNGRGDWGRSADYTASEMVAPTNTETTLKANMSTKMRRNLQRATVQGLYEIRRGSNVPEKEARKDARRVYNRIQKLL